MLARLFALIICLAAIIACTLTIYDIPGWANMTTEFRVIICYIGGVATFLLGVLITVPQQTFTVRPDQRTERRLRTLQ